MSVLHVTKRYDIKITSHFERTYPFDMNKIIDDGYTILNKVFLAIAIIQY